MSSQCRPSLGKQSFVCWNWKCALLSATARSLVYLTAMARTGLHGRLAVILVEMIYVTLTAGIYAGMQQRALALRSRLLGNSVVVLVVPGFAQILDWTAHRFTGATAGARATVAVSIFSAVSALFHLHVMRNGVFLTGHGHSLADDFRRIPRLVLGFILKPVAFLTAVTSRSGRPIESEAAL